MGDRTFLEGRRVRHVETGREAVVSCVLVPEPPLGPVQPHTLPAGSDTMSASIEFMRWLGRHDERDVMIEGGERWRHGKYLVLDYGAWVEPTKVRQVVLSEVALDRMTPEQVGRASRRDSAAWRRDVKNRTGIDIDEVVRQVVEDGDGDAEGPG